MLEEQIIKNISVAGDAVDDLLASFVHIAKRAGGTLHLTPAMTSKLILTLKDGNNIIRSKLASKALMVSDEGMELAGQIAAQVLPSVLGSSESQNAYQSAYLSALGPIILKRCSVFEEDMDSLTDLLVKQILLKNHTEDQPESEMEWMQLREIPVAFLQKLSALEILVNRLRANETEEAIVEVARPVLKLLGSIISHAGEIVPTEDTPYGPHFTCKSNFAVHVLNHVYVSLRPYIYYV